MLAPGRGMHLLPAHCRMNPGQESAAHRMKREAVRQRRMLYVLPVLRDAPWQRIAPAV